MGTFTLESDFCVPPSKCVCFGWVVLVIAEDNAFGYEEVHGDGANSRDPYDGAVRSLCKHSNAKIKTVITICSGDVKPKIENR